MMMFTATACLRVSVDRFLNEQV